MSPLTVDLLLPFACPSAAASVTGALFAMVPVRYRPNAASGGWSYGRGLVHCREN